ncbi:MAG: hypothetical protein J5441_03515 [Clostridia bacterium]|nr:hypothetical protein [Clostridia bacterium]
MSIKGIGGVVFSEISSYPIGTMLYINKPAHFTPTGLLIEGFESKDYDEECVVDICGIPYLDINTSIPGIL